MVLLDQELGGTATLEILIDQPAQELFDDSLFEDDDLFEDDLFEDDSSERGTGCPDRMSSKVSGCSLLLPDLVQSRRTVVLELRCRRRSS